jgi:hypothetical protein
MIVAMNPQRWTIAGWVFLAAAALLALASVWEAFDSLRTVTVQPLGPGIGTTAVAANVLLRAVVLGVLAGTAFFTGLACFFWGAARRLEQILDRLANDR